MAIFPTHQTMPITGLTSAMLTQHTAAVAARPITFPRQQYPILVPAEGAARRDNLSSVWHAARRLLDDWEVYTLDDDIMFRTDTMAVLHYIDRALVLARHLKGGMHVSYLWMVKGVKALGDNCQWLEPSGQYLSSGPWYDGYVPPAHQDMMAAYHKLMQNQMVGGLAQTAPPPTPPWSTHPGLNQWGQVGQAGQAVWTSESVTTAGRDYFLDAFKNNK